MILFGISIAGFLIYAVYRSRRALQMLQQNYYNESNRYILWISKNLKKVFVSFDLILLLLPLFLLININSNIVILIASILCIVLIILYHKSEVTDQNKKPLVITSRVKRLMVTETILYLISIVIMLCNYVDKLVPFYYFIISLMLYLNYFMVYIANIINIPVEKLVYLYYKNKALKKMKDMNIPVIGITGSYGKTSSKNIINTILNAKYNSFATPENFNTTYGLINSINNYLDKFNDIFIAEMGAFKVGEISKTCKFIKPNHGVLTTIGEAHLESFGSRENICKAKFELIESLPKDSIAVLNKDDKWQTSYKLKNKNCKVLWIGIDNEADINALNIKLSNRGTSFDVKFKDDDTVYNFETRLLGKHNVYNLLGGIILAYNLGLTIDEIKRGVLNIVPTEHRLELKRSGNINIIDDAYNSNPVGSKMALDVLKLMPGVKIVCTPGMIELGSKQYSANKEFGKNISKSCDYVILVGKEQTKPILDGLKEENFDEDKIFIVNRVLDAFGIMNELDEGDTYVLLENDLPDLFNE